LTERDLDFSQGDFNVDVVVALGVTEPDDLDAAITAHGRILHDATVVSVSTVGQGTLGSINWVDPNASSLSEMIVSLTDGFDKKTLDNQIATALLTGIVASTERFSNDKTTPKTMSASATLMAAGANQQLIATELSAREALPVAATQTDSPVADKSQPQENVDQTVVAPVEPGTLEIDHEATSEAAQDLPVPEESHPQVQVDENGQFISGAAEDTTKISAVRGIPNNDNASGPSHERLVDPPKMGDTNLTANTSPEALDPPTEELSLPPVPAPLLSHNESVLPPTGQSTVPTPFGPPIPPAPADPYAPDTTLTEIEKLIGSPHAQSDSSVDTADVPVGTNVNDARSAVEAAYSGSGVSRDPLQPIAALNAQPLGPELHDTQPLTPVQFTPPAPTAFPNTGFSEPTPGNTPADDALDMPLPSNPFGPGTSAAPSPFGPPLAATPQAPPSTFPGIPQQGNAGLNGQTPPPPVPPPMLPPLQ
jgi:hypothetical protein